MSSARPVPPAVHLTPAQRAALLQQTAPTFTSTPPAATPATTQLPATAVLAGRSPSGHILPKRDTSKLVTAQPMPPLLQPHSQQLPEQPHPPPQPQQPQNGTAQHSGYSASAQLFKHAPEPAVLSQSAPVNASPATVPSADATPSASPASSVPQSPASHPRPTPHPVSIQRPDPLPSSSPRVREHQQPLLDSLYELIHEEVGVGHWQGLTTQQRKDIASKLCREHLFNPQPASGKDSRTEVQWQAQGSWTEFDVWVTCVRTVSPYYQGDVFTTTYTAHFDQVGRLIEFNEKETKGKKNCVIQ